MNVLDGMGVSKLSGFFYSGSELILWSHHVTEKSVTSPEELCNIVIENYK